MPVLRAWLFGLGKPAPSWPIWHRFVVGGGLVSGFFLTENNCGSRCGSSSKPDFPHRNFLFVLGKLLGASDELGCMDAQRIHSWIWSQSCFDLQTLAYSQGLVPVWHYQAGTYLNAQGVLHLRNKLSLRYTGTWETVKILVIPESGFCSRCVFTGLRLLQPLVEKLAASSFWDLRAQTPSCRIPPSSPLQE